MPTDPSRAHWQVALFGDPPGGIARDFYGEYENDPGGYDHLLLKLRAHVCGTRVGEVVAGSGGVATAISS